MSVQSPTENEARKRVLLESGASNWWGWYFVSVAAATLVPCLILILGVIAKLLEEGKLQGESVSLGSFLAVPIPGSLSTREPVVQLTVLVAIGFVVAVVQSISLYLFYRGLYQRARIVMRRLHEQVLETSIRVAEAEGVTAQRMRTGRLIDRALPVVHQGAIDHWRAVPRSIVLTILCTALAVSVDVWLTLLALISGLFVWIVFRWLDDSARASQARFDIDTIRQNLVESVQTAPVVARVRGDEKPVDESGGPLGKLIEAIAARDSGRERIVPIVVVLAVFFVAFLLVALGANMLLQESPLSISAALVLVLSLVGAVIGAIRIIRSFNRQTRFREASEEVYGFIDRAEKQRDRQLMGLGGSQHIVEFDRATMVDGVGRPLLDNLSLRMEPGTLVAMMGTDGVSLGALADLVMGFGKPKSGQVKIGEVPVSDLHPQWLSKNVLWVGKNGPIWAGSIQDNFRYGETLPDLTLVTEAARHVGIYDRIQFLSDGFSTLVDSDDSRLDDSLRYGIALARAWLRKPPVIIVQELPVPPGTLAGDPGLESLVELAGQGSVVIIMPQRLQTLRKTDRVVLLNRGQIAGEGKHEQLLADSDLYRHLNYVLFNPYRTMA